MFRTTLFRTSFLPVACLCLFLCGCAGGGDSPSLSMGVGSHGAGAGLSTGGGYEPSVGMGFGSFFSGPSFGGLFFSLPMGYFGSWDKNPPALPAPAENNAAQAGQAGLPAGGDAPAATGLSPAAAE